MDFLADLRYALRLLRKTPVFTIAAIGTLALGIGASSTIVSLASAIPAVRAARVGPMLVLRDQ